MRASKCWQCILICVMKLSESVKPDVFCHVIMTLETNIYLDAVFRDVTLCSLVDIHKCFKGNYCLHLFYPEYEGKRILRNINNDV
jgi:hypothetical protein